MVDHARARIFPEVIIVAMAHGFDQPGFIIGSELERCGTGAQRQPADVVADVRTHFDQRGGCSRIFRGAPCRRDLIRFCRRHSECQHPVKKTKLEGAIVAHAVAAEVRHGVARDHCLNVRSIRDGESMLGRAAVGSPHGADAAVGPRLRADPFRSIESVVRIVANRAPVSF